MMEATVGIEKGFYFICDGGYLPTRISSMIPLKGFGEIIWNRQEKIDVESCFFGILEKRFMILKNPMRLHNSEQIRNVVITCC